ncbi:putative membrane protein YesL [Anaerobacterium chartisolvens]|uniref:Putative membrane protein YesL n=1 Tax=Anaerobacterium chartisolvens TaxID=1297424 RepID=A0A369B074_9FIRM|nr:DUF624 domain-containing protein [Anaerobacterium chartisolvens]RCX13836.1 putative membrane protein YesL [Anaerobacterium chartisolvens]
MAGLFGFFDYTKPGPGVPENGPPKARIVVFFEIFTRKFWNLMKLNIMFFIFNIPALIAMLFIVPQYYLNKTFSEDIFVDFILKFTVGAIFLCIPLITVGPAQAGFTYVLRNYAREEHAFLWGDFKEHAMKNFKQGLIVSLIDLLVVIVIGIDINIYISLNSSNFLMTIATSLLFLAFVTYVIMHMYIYPMMVTFKFSIKQIFKNALIFAIMGFIPNILILLLCVVIIGVTFLILPVIGLILFPFITMSLIGLITNFYIYPKLKKHIMDKVEGESEPAGEDAGKQD